MILYITCPLCSSDYYMPPSSSLVIIYLLAPIFSPCSNFKLHGTQNLGKLVTKQNTLFQASTHSLTIHPQDIQVVKPHGIEVIGKSSLLND